MRTRPVWTLLVALVAILTLASSPAALAQGDGPIEPITTPDETDITPPPNEGDGTIEPEPGDEFPIGEQPPPVEPAEPYRVDVQCAFAPDTGTTACAFTGVPPAGQSAPAVFVVPVELVCAEVIGGQYAYVAPDPVTGLNGFRPIGNAGVLTLELDAVVTPAGTATYWFQAPDGIVPGTGPALSCSPAPPRQQATSAPPARQPTPAPTPTPTPVPTTGTLVVRTHTCADVPAERAGYDWFGECEPLAYHLAPAGTQVTPPPVATAAAEAEFVELAPGTYDLEAMGLTWCHAVSDNVTPAGEVMVETGARTTVWIFLCTGG